MQHNYSRSASKYPFKSIPTFRFSQQGVFYYILQLLKTIKYYKHNKLSGPNKCVHSTPQPQVNERINVKNDHVAMSRADSG